MGIKSYFIGSEIILNDDSTFKYTTCGNVMTGSWNHSKDSLFLKIITNHWRNDSLDKNGLNGKWPLIAKRPIGFKFSNNYLTKIHILKNGTKVIEKLKFNVP